MEDDSEEEDQPSPEDQLIVAAGEGNLVRVRELLRENPDMSIKLGDESTLQSPILKVALHCGKRAALDLLRWLSGS